MQVSQCKSPRPQGWGGSQPTAGQQWYMIQNCFFSVKDHTATKATENFGKSRCPLKLHNPSRVHSVCELAGITAEWKNPRTFFEEDEVRAMFQSLDLSARDSWTLFKLLDEEGNGDINLMATWCNSRGRPLISVFSLVFLSLPNTAYMYHIHIHAPASSQCPLHDLERTF